MRIFNSMTELIGHTPLLRLQNFEREFSLFATVLAKLECMNPAGSAKDRVGLSMIADAEARGLLQPGAVIIEPTSGNTGIGLAAVAATRGYQTILTMPETMSVERRRLLAAYGAKIILTDGKKGMAGAIEKAQQLAAEMPRAFLAGQFENPANPAAHYASTGPEIFDDTDGTVDIFVAGVGTGGTLSGVGRYLKEKKPSVRIVGVEPAGSPVLSGGEPGPHGLMGIGAGFVPKNFDAKVCDEVLTVTEQSAYAGGRFLAQHEGILVGITAGAAIAAARVLAERPENKGKTIVALLPDTGERYLSTPMFAEEG